MQFQRRVNYNEAMFGVPIILGILLLSSTWQVAGVPTVGKVARLIPRADLTRAARTMRLNENDAVAENDRIRTAAGGRTRITLNDGSILNVGSASELVVKVTQGAGQASNLELRYGRVRAWVAARAGASPFQVRTQTAVCGVLGTTIFVDASRDLTRVANLSAEATARVRVISTNSAMAQEVILLPGEGTAVPSNRPPQPPRRWTREEMQSAYEDTDIR